MKTKENKMTVKQQDAAISKALKSDLYSLTFLCDFAAQRLQSNRKNESYWYGIKTNQVKKSELAKAIKAAVLERAFFRNEEGFISKAKNHYSEVEYITNKEGVIAPKKEFLCCKFEKVEKFTFEYITKVLKNYGAKAKETKLVNYEDNYDIFINVIEAPVK